MQEKRAKRNSLVKGFVIGAVAMLTLSATVVMANPVMRELVFGVGVSFNGEVQNFEDDMRPFTIDGRTFLPVRAIADIVGLDVDFNNTTNTVLLTTPNVAGTPDTASTQTSSTTPTSTAGISQALVGTWMWMNIEYYVFNADGSGLMSNSAISWNTNNSVLYICTTPDFCGDICRAPSRWTYNITGNQMVLQSVTSDLQFTYTRR
ncbi:MAG: copper amine oxidase N-terminal domain-containing protein [Defluviitaleaceae bacterium]|nr:copper amine oxidase N-terminal domain-containing protein [Defluviitaleaceae bacterium]